MPLPAGTGLTRRASSRASARRSRSPSTAARQLGLLAFEEGIAARRGRRPGSRSSSSVFLEGGADGLSMLYPAGRPALPEAPPDARALGRYGVHRGPAPLLAPGAGRLAQLYGEEKVTVLPAIGYTHPDQSHFTSRHYWEVGATDTRPADRAGSAAISTLSARRTTRSRALSLDDTLAPALATAKMPVAAIYGRPTSTTSTRTRVWGRSSTGCSSRSACFGVRTQPTRRCVRPAVVGAGRPAAQPAAAVRGQQTVSSAPEPGAVPELRRRLSAQLAGLAAMIAAGLPMRVVALTAPGEYDTHAERAAALTEGLQLTADSLLAFQRDLEARGIADRVLVHVWSEFGRRAAGERRRRHRPRRSRRGLPDRRRARREDGRRVPRAPGRRASTTTATSSDGRLPRRLRRAARAVARHRRRAVIPGASAFTRPTLLKS